MSLPVSRLAACGASESEVAKLVDEHDAMLPEVKESNLAALARKADEDVREWLARLRKAGHFGGAVEKPENDDEAVADVTSGETKQTPAAEQPKAQTPAPGATA